MDPEKMKSLKKLISAKDEAEDNNMDFNNVEVPDAKKNQFFSEQSSA